MAKKTLIAATWLAAAFLFFWHGAAFVETVLPHPFMGNTGQLPDVGVIGPQSAGARSGLLSHDRYDMHDLGTSAFVDAALSGKMVAGKTYPIVVFRKQPNGSDVRKRLMFVPETTPLFAIRPVKTVILLANALVFMLCIGIVTWLVTQRPSALTVALFAATLPFGMPQIFGLQPPLSIIASVIATLLFQGGLTAAIVIFALRFPDDKVSGWRITAERATLVFVALSEALLCAAALVAASHSETADALIGRDFDRYQTPFYVVQACTVVLAAVIVWSRFRTSTQLVRGQLAWVVPGMLAAMIAYGLSLTLSVSATTDAWEAIAVVAYLALPVSACYALLCTRFVDPRYAVNRLLVSTLTLVAVGFAFKGLEWLGDRQIFPAVGQWLAVHVVEPLQLGKAFGGSAQLGTVVESVIAVTFGLALKQTHGWFDAKIKGALFADKHEAEKFVGDLGRTLVFATAETEVEEAMARDAPRTMRLASAAYFRATPSGSFVRGMATNWSDTQLHELSAHDTLVRFLKSRLQPVRLKKIQWAHDNVPDGTATPDLAVPVVLRNDIVAFVIYAAHDSHFEIDDDEVDTLAGLADHAAWAFDHIEAVALRRSPFRTRFILRSSAPLQPSPAPLPAPSSAPPHAVAADEPQSSG